MCRICRHAGISLTHSYSPGSSGHITCCQVAVGTEERLPSRFCTRPALCFICPFDKRLDTFLCSDVHIRQERRTCFAWIKCFFILKYLIPKQARRAHSWHEMYVAVRQVTRRWIRYKKRRMTTSICFFLRYILSYQATHVWNKYFFFIKEAHNPWLMLSQRIICLSRAQTDDLKYQSSTFFLNNCETCGAIKIILSTGKQNETKNIKWQWHAGHRVHTAWLYKEQQLDVTHTPTAFCTSTHSSFIFRYIINH